MWPFNNPYRHRQVRTYARRYTHGECEHILRVALDVNFNVQGVLVKSIREQAHKYVDDMLDIAFTEELSHPSCGKGAR